MRRLAVYSLVVLGTAGLTACSVAPKPAELGHGDGEDGDADGDGGTSAGDDGETVDNALPAREITIDRVTVNQGIQIPLYKDGAWVEGADRNAQIINGRKALIRAFYAYDEDTWEPRDIRGRLTLTFADGTVETADKRITVDAPAHDGSLDRSFFWMLPEELVLPGMKFQVELFEVDRSREDETLDTPPVAPDKPMLIGVESSTQELNVVIVPIAHTVEGRDCPGEPPTIDESVLKVFRDTLHMMNPTNEVELRLHDPIVWDQATSSGGGFSPLLNHLAFDVREEDGAGVDEYYYGIIRVCDGGPENVGGQAIDIPRTPTRGNAWSRTSVGRYYGGANGKGTFVHEVGHTQGRRHIECNGEEGGADPSYPYESGIIGAWGFGIENWSLHTPTGGKDYMTYCGNRWVSDWTWRKVYPVIQEISSWQFEAPPEGQSERSVLVGSVYPDGTSDWYTTRGDADDRLPTAGEYVVFERDGETIELNASVTKRPHSEVLNVVAEIPREFRTKPNFALTRITQGHSEKIPAERIHYQHSSRLSL